MKKTLTILGLFFLLTLSFTACQIDDNALEQLDQEQQEKKKRDSDKHPKLEYITTANNNDAYNPGERRPSKLKYTLQSKDDSLHVFFQIDTINETICLDMTCHFVAYASFSPLA